MPRGVCLCGFALLRSPAYVPALPHLAADDPAVTRQREVLRGQASAEFLADFNGIDVTAFVAQQHVQHTYN